VDSDDLALFRQIEDPLDRARRAHAAMSELPAIRYGAITEASAAHTLTAIGEALGISRQAISKILHGGPGPERAFWAAGKGPVTVAVGGKTEAPKTAGAPGPVIAVEDASARDMLRAHLGELGIEMRAEVIPPSGVINLNRPGLVVICGPRLSPLIAQMLAADRSLGFDHDSRDAWYLKDHETGSIWRSPIDSDQPSDIAYAGRLMRPDRRGTFLYIAGIHAAGAAGAVHYLTRNLAETWQQVKERRFSTLIRCDFDPETRSIVSSERITDFREGA